MKSRTLILKDFDGSQRAVIGEADLPMNIGPNTLSITFQVMDIHSAYSFLLERPWIHVTWALTSMFHLKLKFIVSDKIILIGEEEDIMVNHLSSFRYIDGDSETMESPFQALKVVNIVAVLPAEEQPKSEPSIAYWKGSKSMVEAINTKGCGKVIELPENKGQFRLVY